MLNSAMETDLIQKLKSSNPRERREAIDAIGKLEDRKALEILKQVYRSDPDPELRQYAREIGQNAWLRLKSVDTVSRLDKAGPENQRSNLLEKPNANNIQEHDAKRNLSEQNRASALAQLKRGADFYVQGNNASAIKALSKAVELDATIARDQMTLNLAEKLIGLPPDEALKLLANKQKIGPLEAALNTSSNQKRNSPRSRIMLWILAFSIITLIAVFLWAIQAGNLNSYFQVAEFIKLDSTKRTVAGHEVYIVLPEGSVLLEGWPVVVAFHGFGGDGKDLLGYARTFTEQGILFLSPTFGGYNPYPGLGPIEPMSQILQEVNSEYPLDPRGAVLLGLSQGGTFAYKFSVYHPEQVTGVVTAGAPGFDSIFPSSLRIPYIFTWGKNDGIQDFVLPEVYELVQDGYNVQYAIVEGYGHEMTPYAVEQALLLFNAR
jgi:predicted esterase